MGKGDVISHAAWDTHVFVALNMGCNIALSEILTLKATLISA